jgi:hypothetical protein
VFYLRLITFSGSAPVKLDTSSKVELGENSTTSMTAVATIKIMISSVLHIFVALGRLGICWIDDAVFMITLPCFL